MWDKKIFTSGKTKLDSDTYLPIQRTSFFTNLNSTVPPPFPFYRAKIISKKKDF